MPEDLTCSLVLDRPDENISGRETAQTANPVQTIDHLMRKKEHPAL